MKKALFFLFLILFGFINAQSELVFVYFTDKPNAANFFLNPTIELSQKSINRRATLGIPLDIKDAPIENSYLVTLQNLGFSTIDQSKWLNGVALQANQTQINVLKTLPFVQSIESFAKNSALVLKQKQTNKWDALQKTMATMTNFNYGNANAQTDQLNLKPLHLAGYTGEGITIAVIDAGFPGVDNGSTFDRLRGLNKLKGGYDFVEKNNQIYNPSLITHGTVVLGAMAGYIQDVFVGTAPDAEYYLYRSEKSTQEIPEEEMYWIEAAEQADRVGADLINTSLGYTEFDDPKYSYTYADMNGTTSFIARASQIATEKGLFLVTAAGNSGTQPWHYISTPADNQKVFTIGAVAADNTSVPFSSYGPNAIGLIKPDAAARGGLAASVNGNGMTTVNGTSIAAPIAAGGIACLLQAFPNKNRETLKNILRNNASLSPNTTAQMGFGILNFGLSYEQLLITNESVASEKLLLYPNPAQNEFTIKTTQKINSIQIYDTLGRKVNTKWSDNNVSITDLPKGIYFVKIETTHHSWVEKLLKE